MFGVAPSLLSSTAALGGDPFFANVMLLTHFNGVSGATTTFDSSPNARALTANGAVSLSDAQVKFGTAASLFAGGYWASPASADFAFPGDFTIEFQARKSVDGAGGYDTVVLTDTSNGSAANGWFIELSSVRGFLFAHAGGIPVISAQNPNDSLYHHWAVSRAGGTIYLFKDGVLLTSAAFTTSVLAQGQFGIGRNDVNSTYPFAGHIDEVRITKGVGRYTANFTPPTAASPDF